MDCVQGGPLGVQPKQTVVNNGLRRWSMEGFDGSLLLRWMDSMLLDGLSFDVAMIRWFFFCFVRDSFDGLGIWLLRWVWVSIRVVGIQVNTDNTACRKDQLALAQIYQGIDYSVFGKIVNAKIAKEAWDVLKLAYKGVDKAQKSKLQSLRREYERYEMSGSKIVEQYLTRVTDLVNKMRIYAENIPHGKVVEKNSLHYAS
ncbi:Retrovirus-related Pol polyprotein from transposon TNT 1-94 [Senna tora]|uniref:Retrovirus-related Pol polyprotein from transposon TNT 1-94 n=2 Tax=Senna tora TaxID=362788 RepID=A0A834SQK3_9FABA|nr:Retrovirus-related Pol polyprotein from transposon TNT 1-94 [Senna tora]